MRSRQHPAVNIVKNYIRGLAVRGAVVAAVEDEVVEVGSSWDAAKQRDDERAVHPLIPLGAVDSLTESGTVRFPHNHLERHCSRRRHHLTVDQKHGREAVLLPYLGAAVCAANANRPNTWTVYHTFKKGVTVGPWSFNCLMRERQRGDRKATCSWFCIKRRHVPFKLLDPRAQAVWGPDTLLYGYINHFAIVETVAWEDQQHELAGAVLFLPHQYHEHTRLEYIDSDPDRALKWVGARVPDTPDNLWVEAGVHVPLKHIDTQVGTAPYLHRFDGAPLTAHPTRIVMFRLQR